jgi:hypothetical protein
MNARVLLVGLVAIVGSGNLVADPTPLGPSPVRTPGLPDQSTLEAPPIPAPPAESSSPMPPSRPSLPANDDPFQQSPRDQATSPVVLTQASEAFAKRRYAEAAAIYSKAQLSKVVLTATQRDEWAYCRLHAVAVRLNQESNEASPSALAHEVDYALRIGSDKLLPFGKQLIDQIRQRGMSMPKTASDWIVQETPNFRLLHRGDKKLAAEVAQTAESARRAMYERWAGPPAGNWSPRCDIYLHPTGAEYARATSKPAAQLGHSTVEIQGGRPVSRRIDLRADDSTILDATLPSEITQVILAELFADEPLPRWAVVGIAGLSETPESVARYRRAIPGLLKDRKLAAVGPFFDKPGFPEAASITSFYAQSVSLVSFLVERRGPKALLAFLREGPRRGYAKAIASHYGFKDMADLQDKWVRHSMGAE